MTARDRSRPRPVSAFLSDRDSSLARIVARSRQIQQLNGCFRAALSGALADHVRIGSVVGDTVTLFLESPAWYARTRFMTDELLRQVQSVPGLAHVRQVNFRVIPSPDFTVPRPGRRLGRRLSAGVAHELLRTAESEPDPALRAVLLRLSRR